VPVAPFESVARKVKVLFIGSVAFGHGLKGSAINEAQPSGVPEIKPALLSEKAGEPGGNEPDTPLTV
jgi:hypothetical protein